MRGKQRHNRIVYQIYGSEYRVGFVQCILQSTKYVCLLYILVRKLTGAGPTDSNRSVVEEFGHKLYKCEFIKSAKVMKILKTV